MQRENPRRSKGKLAAKKKRGRTASSGFKYKVRSSDTLKKRAEQKGGKFDSPYQQQFDIWKPKGGDNTVRILPPTWDDHDHFGLDIWLHRWIGTDGSNYLCLQKMKNKPCPICKAAKEAKDAGEADEAKDLEASRVVLTWILDRDADDDNPILWPMSWTIDRDIANLSRNKKSGKVLLIDHPDEGYDITFLRTGEGLKTRYSAFQIDREPSPISDDADTQETVLSFVTDNPLPTVLKYYDATYLEGVLAGLVEGKDEDLDEDEDEDEEETTTKKGRGKKKPVRTRGRKQEDEEEEEDDDDDAEEEEDEDDAEEEDEDAEEEDEDEDEDDDDADAEEDDDAGQDDDDDDDEAEEEEEKKPARRKSAKPARRRPGGSSGTTKRKRR